MKIEEMTIQNTADEKVEELFGRLRDKAINGDVSAMETLAELYEDAYFFHYDKEESRKWWKIALEHGSEEAIKHVGYSEA